MRHLRNILLGLLAVVLVGVVAFTFWVRDRYVVPILMYHHVGIPSGKWRLNTVSEKSFDYQMSFLKRHGFRVITTGDLVKGIKEGQEFLRNVVVIQFDDGYEDNYKYAFPILKKYGFPATVFLISSQIGTNPDFLTWEQVKEMERNNINFGAHTVHHAYLPDLPLDQAQAEILGSKKQIEENLGHSVDYFCYPVGGFSADIKKMVEEDGFQAAMTTNRGKERYNFDLYELKRIHMNNTDFKYSGVIMWFKLSGYYNLFRHFKHNKVHKNYE